VRVFLRFHTVTSLLESFPFICLSNNTATGWQRCIGCLRLQISFRKRATSFWALLRKMTSKDKASYDSTPQGYRDSARLFGESCWQKNWRVIRGKKLHGNREIVVEWWGCGSTRTVDSGLKWDQSWNQILTLKECLCCHIYCAHLGTPWYQIVGDSSTFSNRESRYPLRYPLPATVSISYSVGQTKRALDRPKVN